MGTENYSLTLKAKSPIHIGSGKDYSSNEFIFQTLKGKNVVKRIDLPKYYNSLSNERQKDFIKDACKIHGFQLTRFDGEIGKKYVKYYCWNYTDADGYENINFKKVLDISEHIKTANQLYIPGSSIKGAIRTAILYDLFTEKDVCRVKSLFDTYDDHSRIFLNNWKYNNFIKPFFSSKNEGDNAAQTDILRFLQISDTTNISTKNPAIEETKTIMAPKNGNHYVHYKRGRAVLETIKKGTKLSASLNINYDSEIHKSLHIDDKEELLDIGYIKEALCNFSRDLINYELDFASRYDVGSLERFYKKLMKVNSEDKPLIRVGFGSGMLANTVAMKVKDMDEESYEAIRKSFRKAYPYEFPKVRRIACHDKEPLGWIQLDFKEKS